MHHTNSTGKYTPEVRQTNQIKLTGPAQKHIISSTRSPNENDLNQENPLYQKSKQLVLNQNKKMNQVSMADQELVAQSIDNSKAGASRPISS